MPFLDTETEDYSISPEATNKPITQVAGWGATNERGRNPADLLQYLDVKVKNAVQCKSVYEERGGIITPLQQMCAGGEKGKDSCVGDSGSALMREHDVRSWKIIGIVSFGPRLCGTEGIPGVYTRVRHYMNWILDNAKS